MNLTRGQESSALCAAENRLSYAGWRVAAVCHIGVLTGFATVFIYSFSFMVKPLQHEFGWNNEQIARAFSLAAISVAICSPFMGRLFDQHRASEADCRDDGGSRFRTWFSCISHAAPDSALCECCFIGIAGTGTYQLGYARIVTGWFERRLGAALSIVVAGSGVGSLLIPPLGAASDFYGWMAPHLPGACGSSRCSWGRRSRSSLLARRRSATTVAQNDPEIVGRHERNGLATGSNIPELLAARTRRVRIIPE